MQEDLESIGRPVRPKLFALFTIVVRFMHTSSRQRALRKDLKNAAWLESAASQLHGSSGFFGRLGGLADENEFRHVQVSGRARVCRGHLRVPPIGSGVRSMNGGSLTGKSMHENISGESPSIALRSETGTICGGVCRFVSGLTGEVNEFILDWGLHVRFPAELDRVMEVLSIGSKVSVDGCMRVNHVGDAYLDATAITSLDSRGSVEFGRASLPQAPAMPSINASSKRDTAPPAPLEWPDGEIRREAKPLRNKAAQAVAFACATKESLPPYAVRSPEDSPTHAPPGAEAPRRAAADGIGQALNGLHRTEVLLTYLLVVNAKGLHVGHRLFDEALRTYEQALAKAEARDFTRAPEFAAASRFLSRAADILILRTMPWSGDHAHRASSSQNAVEALNAATLAEDQLQRVEGLLSRIRQLVNGDRASTADRAQIQKLVLRGGTLYGQARCFVYDGRIEDAIELAHAAEAVTRSAEHLCRASELL